MYEVDEPEIDEAVELYTEDRGPWTIPDCLYLQVGAERGDSVGTGRISQMAKEICRIARMTDTRVVVIHAVAGMADGDRRAGVTEAMLATAALAARLADGGLEVHVTPFGWHKRITPMDILPGVWAQRWVETSRRPFIQEALLTGAVGA